MLDVSFPSPFPSLKPDRPRKPKPGQLALAFAPVPEDVQLRFTFEPSPDDPLEDLDEHDLGDCWPARNFESRA